MAEFSLPPPAPFLAVPGKPPVPWNNWLESFKTYPESYEPFYNLRQAEESTAPSLTQYRETEDFQSAWISSYIHAVSLLPNHFAGKE